MQTSCSDFRADGEEAFLPRSKRANGIFLLEEYKLADWRFELGARQDWQTVSPQGRRAAQQPVGHLAVGGSHLELRAGYSAALSLSRSQRLPTAQELYARACTWPPTPMRSATPAEPRDLAQHRPDAAQALGRNHFQRQRVPQPREELHLRQHAGPLRGLPPDRVHPARRRVHRRGRRAAASVHARVLGRRLRRLRARQADRRRRQPAAHPGGARRPARQLQVAAVVGRRRVRARVLAEGHRRLREQRPATTWSTPSWPIAAITARPATSLPARHQPAEQAGLQPCLVHLLGGAAAWPACCWACA